MTVHGTNLDSIQKPEIEVYYDDERINKSICSVLNPNQMECPSPAVNLKFVSYMRHLEEINGNIIAGTNQSRSKKATQHNNYRINSSSDDRGNTDE